MGCRRINLKHPATIIIITLTVFTMLTITSLMFYGLSYKATIPETHVRKGPTVFFVETSGKNQFPLKEACAIESAARAHPQSDIKVILTSPIFVNIKSQLPDYENIYYIRSQISHIIQETPLEKWWAAYGNRSAFWEYHLSDALRLALLWRHGGIYLDLDTLTLKCMSNLKNTLGTKRAREVSSSTLIFDRNHTFLSECMLEFVNDYHLHSRDHQGSLLLDRQLRLQCNLPPMSSYKEIVNRREKCNDINVLPSDAFNPISFYNWNWYFQKNETLLMLFKNSYTCHLWGRMSNKVNATVGNGIILDILAKDVCPQVYHYGLKQKSFY